jgi:hypothetical protein
MMTRLSAIVAMYAVACFGFLLVRRSRHWSLVGTALGMMLANVLLFTVVSTVTWRVVPLVTQMLVTGALSWSIWKEKSV